MSETAGVQVRSLWADAWRRLKRNRLAMLCLGVIGLYVALGLLDFVPTIRRTEDGRARLTREVTLLDLAFRHLVGPVNKQDSYVAPGVERHLLGTDIHGVDVLYKAVKGISTAITLGFGTSAIAIPFGLLLGMIAGYFGKRIDDLIVYVYSTLACIPSILLLIGLMTALGKGVPQLCIAMGVTGWVGLCRLVRGETLKLREADYVLASRAAGASSARVILRHIMPNLIHIVIITFTLGFSGIVMSEAVLTYLGVGVEADTISWGMMISTAKMELARHPIVYWQFLSSAAALFLLVLAFNIFGDALRDALEPKLRTE
jgi:ABC-type dipeptide/oligopeptide/nickel transport system permease subunit